MPDASSSSGIGELLLSSTYLAPLEGEQRHYAQATRQHLVLAGGREVIHAQACADHVQVFSGADAQLERSVWFEEAVRDQRVGESSTASKSQQESERLNVRAIALSQPSLGSSEVWVSTGARGSDLGVPYDCTCSFVLTSPPPPDASSPLPPAPPSASGPAFPPRQAAGDGRITRRSTFLSSPLRLHHPPAAVQHQAAGSRGSHPLRCTATRSRSRTGGALGHSSRCTRSTRASASGGASGLLPQLLPQRRKRSGEGRSWRWTGRRTGSTSP